MALDMSNVPTSGSKVATIQVSAGSDDERDLETFAEEVKEAIAAAGVAKRATYLTGYYLVEGQPIRPDGKHAITGEDSEEKDERPKKKAAKKKAAKKSTAKTKPEPEPEEEPEEEYDGTEGQDRESYTDDQDRESYTVSVEEEVDYEVDEVAQELGSALRAKEEAARSVAKKVGISMRRKEGNDA